MQPFTPDDLPAEATGWGIHGDPTLLVDAARRLRLSIEVGVYRSHPPGEYAMFGVARLLDAVADSMRAGAVHHTVVSAATEISHHVLTHLLPAAAPGPPGRGVPAACTTCPRPATPTGHEVLIHHPSQKGTSGDAG